MKLLLLLLRSGSARAYQRRSYASIRYISSVCTLQLCCSVHQSCAVGRDDGNTEKDQLTNRRDSAVSPTASTYGALMDSARTKPQISNREQFALVLNEFLAREKYRRGHVAFINMAMKRMEEFGLEKDLLTYNRLLDIFPKGRFHPKRLLDAFWPRPLPQTELALELLTRMEDNNVWPDHVTYSILVEVFGKNGLPVEKCERMLYWFQRYEGTDPYWIEGDLPEDQVELSKLTLQRIVGDKGNIREHKVPAVGESSDFLLSGSTASQMKLLKSLSTALSSSTTTTNNDVATTTSSSSASSPPTSLSHSLIISPSSSFTPLLYVEGPHRIWINKCPMHYFSLRLSADDSKLLVQGQGEEEGLVLGVCMCHPPTQESLQQWLRALQETYPSLSDATIVYSIRQDNTSQNAVLGDSHLVMRTLKDAHDTS